MNRIALNAGVLLMVTLMFEPISHAEPQSAESLTEFSPIVIAHRGASGQRPEHTLAAYELALAEGADFIELDLVATRDGVLIARHENALAMVAIDAAGSVVMDSQGRVQVLETTTDVAERPEFADRLTVKSIDGRTIGGWFSEDFSMAEIRQLKARERLPDLRPQNRLYDDRYGIPALAEVIDLLRDYQQRTGLVAGLYLELKHPTYFHYEGRHLDGSRIGQDLGLSLLAELQAADFLNGQRLFIQAFEVAPLIELKDHLDQIGVDIPLIQLYGDVFNLRFRAAPRDMIYFAGQSDTDRYGELKGLIEGGIRSSMSYAELATPAVLRFMAQRYAAGIGPTRQNVMLTSIDAEGRRTFTGNFGALLGDALEAGLLVHPYTLRAESAFLLRVDERLMPVAEEVRLLLEAGVQGFFIDQPGEGRLAVDRYQPRRKLEPDRGL